jgi:hypothetical protein
MKDYSPIIYGSINKPINGKDFSMLVQAVITEISNTDVISVCLLKDPSTSCSGNSDSMRITCPAATHNWNNGPAVSSESVCETFQLRPLSMASLCDRKKKQTGSTKRQSQLNLLLSFIAGYMFRYQESHYQAFINIYNMEDIKYNDPTNELVYNTRESQ